MGRRVAIENLDLKSGAAALAADHPNSVSADLVHSFTAPDLHEGQVHGHATKVQTLPGAAPDEFDERGHVHQITVAQDFSCRLTGEGAAARTIGEKYFSGVGMYVIW